MDSKKNLITQMIGHNAILFEEGEFLIWNIPSMIYPINTLIQMHVHMKKLIEEEYANSLMYQLGRNQARQGAEIMVKRFGYKISRKTADYANQQGEFVGIGRQEYLKFDMKEKHFIIRIRNTPYAKQYRKLHGIQKEPVDHFIRGLITGANEAYAQTTLIGIETQCIAQGKPCCIFEIKEKWDKSRLKDIKDILGKQDTSIQSLLKPRS